MSGSVTDTPPGCCCDALMWADEAALEVSEAAVLAAGWEAWERSLGAGLAAERAAEVDGSGVLAGGPADGPALVDGLALTDGLALADELHLLDDDALGPAADGPRADRSGASTAAEVDALRAARQSADVPLAAPGVRPDTPAVSALAAQLDAAERAIEALLAAPASGSQADVARALRLTERLRAVGLRELAEMDALGTHSLAGGMKRSTRSWLAAELHLGADVAGSTVRLATELRDLPLINQALAAGDTTAEHCRAITDGMRGLDLPTVQDSQASLLTLTRGLTPAEARRGLKEIALALDDALAADAERKARDRAGYTISPVGDRYSSTGSHDSEHGALLHQALHLEAARLKADGDTRPIAALREQVLIDWAARALHEQADADSTSQDIHTSRTHLIIGATVEQLNAASNTSTPACDCAVLSDDPGHEPDCPRTPAQLTLPGALDAVIKAGPGGHADLAPVNISAGTSLSRGALRRLTCDAVVGIIALGKDPDDPASYPDGQVPPRQWEHGNRDPLWVGRNARTVTKQQWLALIHRDRHCVVQGCQRRPAGCVAHHVRHWLDGGPSDLDNYVLVCEQHHHDHHDRGIDLPHRDGTRWMTQTGWKWLTANGWTTADPEQEPSPTSLDSSVSAG